MSGLERAHQWLSLLANIGVIAGFIMIAVQLNLNTTAIRLQNAMNLNRDASAAEIAHMGETAHEAFAAAVFRPTEMTENQVGQVWSYLNVALNSALNTWIAYQSGVATAADWEDAKRISLNYLAFEVGQIYWRNTASDYYPPDFVAAIDAGLADIDKDLLANQFKSIVNEVRQIRGDAH